MYEGSFVEYQVANISRPIWQGPQAPTAQMPAPATQPLGGVPGYGPVPTMPYYTPTMVPPPPPMPAPMAAMPTWSPAPYLANSVPLASPWELPRPEQLAPELYMPPHTHGIPSPTAYNTYNNYMMPPGGQPQPYYPAGQPLGQQQPAQPTPPAEQPKPAEAPIAPPKNVPTLNTQTVNELNSDMQSNDSDTRMRAANRLSKILEGDPNLLSNPNTKEYAEALILKVLNDPVSLVRQPILLAMELGWLNTPTPKIMNTLQALKGEQGLYNFEPGIIDKVMGGLRAKWNATQQAFAGTAAAAEANPAAAPLTAPLEQKTTTVTPTGVAQGGVGNTAGLQNLAAQMAYKQPAMAMAGGARV